MKRMKVDTKWTLTNYSQACLGGLSTHSCKSRLTHQIQAWVQAQRTVCHFSSCEWATALKKKPWLSFPGPFKHSHPWMFSPHCFSCSFENNVTLHWYNMMQLTKYFTHTESHFVPVTALGLSQGWLHFTDEETDSLNNCYKATHF